MCIIYDGNWISVLMYFLLKDTVYYELSLLVTISLHTPKVNHVYDSKA